MANQDESQLVIEFEDTGEAFSAATSFSIQSAFTVPADAWSCVVANESDPVALRRKFYPGRPIRLFLSDRLQLIGRIGRTQGVGGSSGALRVSGRDYFADLIDPNVDPSTRVTNRMTLADALLEGLRPLGITEVESDLEEVISKKMGPVQFETKRGDPSAFNRTVAENPDQYDPDTRAIAAQIFETVKVPITEPVTEAMPRKGGEGAYEWAARIAARYHLTIQPGTKRTSIAVVAPDYSSKSRFAFHRPGNIETATCVRDGEDVPSFVNASGRHVDEKSLARGGFSGISLADEGSQFQTSNEGKKFVEASGMVIGRKKRTETNTPPALYKPIYFTDDKAKSAKELESAAARMLANKTRGFFKYVATLASHVDPQTGAIYATNTMADAFDAIEDVADRLWISETNLSQGEGGGKRAEITMILPGTYVI